MQEPAPSVQCLTPLQGSLYCTGMYTGIKTLTFLIGLNTDRTNHTGQFRVILAGTGVPAGTEKSF